MLMLSQTGIIMLAVLYTKRPSLRGLAVLSSYGPERPWRAISDLAKELNMSPSTTHRYVKTLRAVGLLEQNPTTREYRPVAI